MMGRKAVLRQGERGHRKGELGDLVVFIPAPLARGRGRMFDLSSSRCSRLRVRSSG